MSTVSSELHKHEYESGPDSPGALTARPWKYLEHPDDDEWMRGPSETQTWPNLGDFVVLSLDPVASVRHLDIAAQEAARQIPVRKFVAAAIETVGLPVNGKPLHPFDYLFVRRGKPSPRLAGRNPDDACVAIQPNNTTVGSRTPVCPAHSLPWSDCYFDMTWGFPFACRSSNVERDYFPVLPMDDDELVRVKGYVQEGFAYSRERFGAKRPDPLSFVDASVDIAATLPHITPDPAQPDPALSAVDGADPGDDVSIIASEDHAGGEDRVGVDDRSVSDCDSDAANDELDMLLRFEAMMKNQGDLRDPVVDTWYGLDMVTEVIDPTLFLQDVKRLQQIINDAEARLRAQAIPTSPEVISAGGASADGRNMERILQDAASSLHGDTVPTASANSNSRPLPVTLTDAQALKSSPSSSPKPIEKLRLRLKTLSTTLSSFARKHVRKLRHGTRTRDASTDQSAV